MALLDELRVALHAGLAAASRTGVALTNRTPGGRETTVGRAIVYEWAAEPPESGWILAGYEYCWEGWYKPSDNISITYLSGYTAQTQPRPVWTRVGPDTMGKTFTSARAGQHTLHVRALHVRAILRDETTGAEHRSAYAGRHTFLVR